MKTIICLVLLTTLPGLAWAAEEKIGDPRSSYFPADYREVQTDPQVGEDIRKYAEDAQEGPQQNFGVQSIHDNQIFATFRADRFEHQWGEHGEERVLWDVVSWVGADYNKLYFESEGTWLEDDDKVEEAQLELLYGRSIATFWDLRLGVRHDIEPDPERTFLTLGVLGLAPLWFEIDANAYVSEEGDVSATLEVEYQLLLTQRLRLVPRLEASASLQDVPEYETWQGITETTLGARLLYQIRREFAPYIGVTWSRKVGETSHNIDRAGGDVESAAWLAGVRFWF